MYRYRVFDDDNHKLLGTFEFNRELAIDECVAKGGTVYRIRSIRHLGASAENKRELHVAETVDTTYVASLD